MSLGGGNKTQTPAEAKTGSPVSSMGSAGLSRVQKSPISFDDAATLPEQVPTSLVELEVPTADVQPASDGHSPETSRQKISHFGPAQHSLRLLLETSFG